MRPEGGRQMGSHVTLVKGNRQMGFQVNRVTNIFVPVEWGRQMGSQVNPMCGQVARENRLLGECGSVTRENRPEWVCVGRSPKIMKSFSFCFLYKAYYAKFWGFSLRKHCKEGASVATQFLTHVFKIFSKTPKNREKQWKAKKYVC